jgi:hypothetical protein
MPQSLRLPALIQRPAAPTQVAPDSALVAAAQAYTPGEWRNAQIFGGNNPWESEAWGFWDTLGEFYQAVDWQSRAMSRIRLGAAEVVPGGDEPEMLTEGPAADLMQSFCGGAPGHSAFLRAITPQLLVPGQGWLIAERDDPFAPLAAAEWGVYSMDCVQGLGGTFQVRVGPGAWRYLAPDNLPMRIYNPHPRWPWLATSSAQAALPIMRRIQLIDSRIVAMMVSRLAMNGIMLIPQEGTIGVPDQYKDAPDPFVAMLIEIASRNIANPGQASAGIPIPIKFTGDLIEKWKILKADDPLDEWLLKERTDELGRLGDSLGIARERVSGGMGQQNHWNLWGINEEEINLSFSPIAETVCGAVTKAYLKPMLVASGQSLVGPQGGKIIVWYDTSELAARPDNSANVRQGYVDGVVNEAAYLREIGLGEADALTDTAEIETWAYKRFIAGGSDALAPAGLAGLTGGSPQPVAPQSPAAGVAAPPAASGAPAVGSPARPSEPATPAAGPPRTNGQAAVAPALTATAGSAPDVNGTLRRVLVEAGALTPERPRRYNGHHVKR